MCTVHPRATHYLISKHFSLISNYHTIYTPSPASRSCHLLLLGWSKRHPHRAETVESSPSWMMLPATITSKWLLGNANKVDKMALRNRKATRTGLELKHLGIARDRCWYWKHSSREQPSDYCKLPIPSPHAHQAEGSLDKNL